MWNSFITFGTLSAGFIGVIIIFRMTKLIADTIIHGYALHTIYGWSIHLLVAIWSSVTNLLLHLGKANKQGNNGNEEIRRPPESSYVAGIESHSSLYPSHQLDASRILPKPSVHYTLSRAWKKREGERPTFYDRRKQQDLRQQGYIKVLTVAIFVPFLSRPWHSNVVEVV